MRLKKEMLNNLFMWFKSMEDAEPMEEYSARLKRNVGLSKSYKKYRFFAFVTDLVGYNLAPEVVSKDAFDRLASKTLYRGSRDGDHNANILVHFDYHRGDGTTTFGLHSTTSEQTALRYASSPEAVMRFKLSDDSRVLNNIDLQSDLGLPSLQYPDVDLKTWSLKDIDPNNTPRGLDGEALRNIMTLVEFINGLDDPDKGEFINLIFGERATFAALIGYDAIAFKDMIIILNRAKMVVYEKEFNRITNSSRNFKNGNFDISETQLMRE